MKFENICRVITSIICGITFFSPSATAGAQGKQAECDIQTNAGQALRDLRRSQPVSGLERLSDYERFLVEYDLEAERFREEGLWFWRTFPADEHRYPWLLFTLGFEPAYAADRMEWLQKSQLPVANDYQVEAEKLLEWHRVYAELREEFLSSPQVSNEQRRLLRWLELRNALFRMRDARARGEQVDNAELLNQVLEYADDYGELLPDDDDSITMRRNLTVLASMLVNREDFISLTPKERGEFLTRLSAIDAEPFADDFGEMTSAGFPELLVRVIRRDGRADTTMPDFIWDAFDGSTALWEGSTVSRMAAIGDTISYVDALIHHVFDFPMLRAPSTWEGRAIFKLHGLEKALEYRELGLAAWPELNSAERFRWLARDTFVNRPPVYPDGILDWVFTAPGSEIRIDEERTFAAMKRANSAVRALSQVDDLDNGRRAIASAIRLWPIMHLVRQNIDGETRTWLRDEFASITADHFSLFPVTDRLARTALATPMASLLKRGDMFEFEDGEAEAFLTPLVQGSGDQLDILVNGFLTRDTLEIGRPISFSARTLEGDEVSTTDLRGNYILVDHWDTNCAPCIADFPAIHEIYLDLKGQGFEVFSIAYDGTSQRRQIERIKDRLGLSWMTLDGEGLWSGVSTQFGFVGFPQYMLIDREGRLIATTKELRPPSQVREILERELDREEMEAE